MTETLTHKKIFRFWLPLSATWLMMSFEGPFLTAIIARMDGQAFNLAAYGVAYTIALIIESPVIMMLSASTTLVENKQTFLKLRQFVYLTNIAVTVAMLIFLIPPIYDFIAVKLINLPMPVAKLSYTSCILLIPWAPSIGYRRFYQGILIKQGKTRHVAYGTAVRMVTMVLTALILFLFSNIEGAEVGAAALSIGVILEAIAVKLMTNPTIKKILREEDPANKNLSYNEIFKFYYPLALTSFISLGFQPVVIFFIGQSRNSLESLAVLPVINSLVFLWRSLGLSIPEVVIALIKTNKEFIVLKSFAERLSVAVVVTLGIITFTPLSDLWLIKVSGLSPQLASFSKLSLMLYTIFPALTVWINFQRAVLIYSRKTNPLTLGILIEVFGMLALIYPAVIYFNIVGVVAAVISLTIGRLAANFYLILPYKNAVNEISINV